jgi:hypothetical protein
MGFIAWNSRWSVRRLDLRAFGNLARRRNDRFHYCGVRGRSNFGLDHPLTEESLKKSILKREFALALATQPG